MIKKEKIFDLTWKNYHNFSWLGPNWEETSKLIVIWYRTCEAPSSTYNVN